MVYIFTTDEKMCSCHFIPNKMLSLCSEILRYTIQINSIKILHRNNILTMHVCVYNYIYNMKHCEQNKCYPRGVRLSEKLV